MSGGMKHRPDVEGGAHRPLALNPIPGLENDTGLHWSG